MDKTQILPGIYQGGQPDIAINMALVPINGIQKQIPIFLDILPEEVEAVLNLRQRHSDQFSVDRLKAYLWLPIEDAPPFPGVKWLNTAVEFIRLCKVNDWSVLVHCLAGVSRSAMVVVAYCMKAEKMSLSQALDFVGSKRSSIHPNKCFLEGLREYELFLKA